MARIRDFGRATRVCLYGSTAGGRSLEPSLDVARRFAEERDWQIGKVFADSYPWSTCAARPGWGCVRSAIRTGLADGVVVLASSVVSSNSGEFDEQRRWFKEQSAFIVVATAWVGHRASQW